MNLSDNVDYNKREDTDEDNGCRLCGISNVCPWCELGLKVQE